MIFELMKFIFVRWPASGRRTSGVACTSEEAQWDPRSYRWDGGSFDRKDRLSCCVIL